MSLFTSLLPAFATSAAPSSRTHTADEDQAPVRRPVYDLSETDEGFALTVNLPGVDKAGLEVTAENGLLVIHGRRGWRRPDEWTALYRETTDTGYRLELAYDDRVDADRIEAALADGVLRVALPKAEASKPRKIAIN